MMLSLGLDLGQPQIRALLSPTDPPDIVVGGVALGSIGAVGSPYEGLRLEAGDDFATMPSRWHPTTLNGRYFAPKFPNANRGQVREKDEGMYIEPSWRGARSQSPTPLGLDGVSVSNSRAVLTAFLPPESVKPFLPTEHVAPNGDAEGKPRVLSGSLKTGPNFLLSAKADWAIEAKVRLADGIARGYWPSFWTSGFPWPDNQEMDLVEGRKDANSAVTRSLVNIIGSETDGGPNNFLNYGPRLSA